METQTFAATWTLKRCHSKVTMRLINNLAVRLIFITAVIAIVFLVTTGTQHADEKPLYMDASKPIDARVEDLLARMTVEEKIALVHADSKFTTAAIPRLGI